MRITLFCFALLTCAVAAGDAAPPKLFPVPPMPPLGANKWSTTPQTIVLTLATDAEIPKSAPPPETHTLDGQLPLADAKGKPIAVKRETDAGGHETGLGIDSGGLGNFFVKVPLSDKQGRTVTLDVSRGPDPVTQRPRTERYALRIFSVDGNWCYQRSGALKGMLNGVPIFLIDANVNGRFDDAGVDLLIYGNGDVQPLADVVTLNNTRYGIKLDPGGGGPLTLTPIPYPDALAAGIEHFNRWRAQLGLPSVKLHDELSRWAQCHTDFLVKNNVTGLGEDPAMPGYKREGAWSGAHCCVVAGPQEISAGIDEFTNSTFHRIMLLSPYLTVTGLGFSPPDPNANGGFAETAIDVGTTGDTGIEWREPIACPADGQTGVSGVWSGLEAPGPLPGEPPPEGVGFPITLTFPSRKAAKYCSIVTAGPIENDMPKNVNCDIAEDAPGAQPLEAFKSDPEHPAIPAQYPDNLSTITLVAKAPLKTDTIYVVNVSCDWRGKMWKKSWRFATGNAQFNPPAKVDNAPVYKRVAPPPVPAR